MIFNDQNLGIAHPAASEQGAFLCRGLPANHGPQSRVGDFHAPAIRLRKLSNRALLLFVLIDWPHATELLLEQSAEGLFSQPFRNEFSKSVPDRTFRRTLKRDGFIHTVNLLLWNRHPFAGCGCFYSPRAA